MNNTYQSPFSDDEMVYDAVSKRYILTPNYVRNQGIDLGLELNTETAPEPAKVPELVLNRISLLVYSNIYSHGRQRKIKEYMIACDPSLRGIIRDAMMERLRYMIESGDTSTRSGALVSQGTRIEVEDLIPSVIEEMILRPTGLLHRGEFYTVLDPKIEY